MWLGDNAIHQITNSADYSLKIYLTGWDNITKYVQYDIVRIAGGYRLTVDGFSGDACDSMIIYHDGQRFSTKDKDNDRKKYVNLAVDFSGAWWFGSQPRSNLNGQYKLGPDSPSGEYSIMWSGFGYGMRYSFKETKMLLQAK